MGRHHIRIVDSTPGVELVAIVDPDTERARQHPVAARGVPVVAGIDDLPDDVDFAVVATPTPYHTPIGLALFERGIHALIEKPLAGNPDDARALVDAAQQAGVILAVGHVERYNPAISSLARLVTRPLSISIERLSPQTPRIQDSVVFDLTIHDLDLACWLAASPVSAVHAVGADVYSGSIDVASTILQFENGCIATLQTSRITEDKVRRITVAEAGRYLIADTIRQDIEIKRQAEVSYRGQDEELTFAQSSVVEIPTIDRSGEPIRREINDFLEAIAGQHVPKVSGTDGLRAVELAARVEELCLEKPA